MNLVNLTPHEITIMGEGWKLSIPASGTVARCAERKTPVGVIYCDGVEIPIIRISFGEVTNLPEPKEDTIYIVSSIVASAAKRDDVLVVADLVRNDQGQIVGARKLAEV
jgi:hypothetical protein